MENTTPQSAYKRKVLKPRFLLDSAEYCARRNELNDGDENDKRNPFLYHFETGFDALCAKNGNLVLTILNECNKIDDVRERLNSPKGHFDEEEALEIWEQCLKYVTEDIFPFYEEGDTDAVDHVWALGIIMAHILCGYPALKGTEDIQCYNNVGIGRPVQSGEQERLELNGHTFPPKKWCNLTPEARKHIKQCIHFHPGNRPCLTTLWFNKWRTTAEEAIIENRPILHTTPTEKTSTVSNTDTTLLPLLVVLPIPPCPYSLLPRSATCFDAAAFACTVTATGTFALLSPAPSTQSPPTPSIAFCSTSTSSSLHNIAFDLTDTIFYPFDLLAHGTPDLLAQLASANPEF
eukprot:jgi/Psemu1/11492/gm1.11492_g